eukprot:4009181-Pleurochrysis_carterae.AAC.1
MKAAHAHRAPSSSKSCQSLRTPARPKEPSPPSCLASETAMGTHQAIRASMNGNTGSAMAISATNAIDNLFRCDEPVRATHLQMRRVATPTSIAPDIAAHERAECAGKLPRHPDQPLAQTSCWRGASSKRQKTAIPARAEGLQAEEGFGPSNSAHQAVREQSLQPRLIVTAERASSQSVEGPRANVICQHARSCDRDDLAKTSGVGKRTVTTGANENANAATVAVGASSTNARAIAAARSAVAAADATIAAFASLNARAVAIAAAAAPANATAATAYTYG